jgi:hypothetical protein
MEFTPADQGNLITWKRAWRLRCCPPETILMAEKISPELANHLLTCPWCKADREDSKILDYPEIIPACAEQQDPQTGELWSITDDQAGWGEKNRFYLPPLVLLIEKHACHVTVMQIYDDATLSGPGDISLEPHYEGFAETWNRYILQIEALGSCWGRIPNALLDAITSDTSANEASIEQGSLLWFFRNMEVETGYYFARQSIAAIIAAEETEDEPLLKYSNAAELIVDLSHLKLRLETQIDDTMNLPDVLARIDLCPDHLPLAAADDRQSLIALQMFIKKGKIVECAPQTCMIMDLNIIEGKVMVSGYCLDPVEQESQLFFLWWKIGADFYPPEPEEYGFEQGTFWATFTIDSSAEEIGGGTLVVRCLRQA